MENIFKNFAFIAKDLKETVLASIPAKFLEEMIGVRSSHNILDPTSVSSVIRNPCLPLCCSIPNGSLELGTLISIYATVRSGGRRFRIDFFLGKCEHVHGDGQSSNSGDELGVERGNIAFHFNPRIGGGADCVVMNSFLNGQWGPEERHSEAFPFRPDQPFRLMILVENECFKIAVDGRHSYEFVHRCDFRDIARIHIEGDLALDLVEFRKELRYLSRSTSTSSMATDDSTPIGDPISQTMASPGMDISTQRHVRDVTSPAVPYFEYEPNLSKPCDIYIAGMLPNHVTENFVINLCNIVESQQSTTEIVNIPVHISVRADINTIVRNTMTNGCWGEEELYLEGPFQLIPGTHFDMMISNRADKVLMAINGQPAFEYKHRHDPKTINALQINGGVNLTSIRFEFKD